MPPSLLQSSMYFVTSCDSNPLAPEGNKPIWPPIWGPDGWLSLLPILSSFVRQDPSRQHGHTISSSRNTQYLCPQTSLQVVTKPNQPLSVNERKKKRYNYARGMFLYKLFLYKLVHYAFGSASLLSTRKFDELIFFCVQHQTSWTIE